jgi:hypothetical protein
MTWPSSDQVGFISCCHVGLLLPIPHAAWETCVQRSYGHLGQVTPFIRVGFVAVWARPLVGFWCEETCHVVSPDPRTRPAPGTWSVACPKLFSWWSSQPVGMWVLARTRRPSPDSIMAVQFRLSLEGTIVLGY